MHQPQWASPAPKQSPQLLRWPHSATFTLSSYTWMTHAIMNTNRSTKKTTRYNTNDFPGPCEWDAGRTWAPHPRWWLQLSVDHYASLVSSWPRLKMALSYQCTHETVSSLHQRQDARWFNQLHFAHALEWTAGRATTSCLLWSIMVWKPGAETYWCLHTV